MPYPHQNKQWTQWSVVEENSSWTDLQVVSKVDNTLLLCGLDANQQLQRREKKMNEEDFSDAIAMSGAGHGGLDNGIHQYIPLSASGQPLAWIAQAPDKTLYRLVGDSWQALNSGEVKQWGAAADNHNALVVYMITPQGLPRAARSTFDSSAAPTWSEYPIIEIIAHGGMSNLTLSQQTDYAAEIVGGMNVDQKFTLVTRDSRLEMKMLRDMNEDVMIHSTSVEHPMPPIAYSAFASFGTDLKMIMDQDGNLLLFANETDGDLSYRSQAGPGTQWRAGEGPRSFGSNLKAYGPFTNSIGVLGVWAIGADDTLYLTQQGEGNNGFEPWTQPFGTDLKVQEVAVGISSFGNLQLLIKDQDGNLLTCSGDLDDSQDDSGLNAKDNASGSLQTLQELTDATPIKEGQPNPKASQITPYKSPIVDWITSLGDLIGEDGYETLMKAESLGQLIESHLKMNDFSPATVLDYMEADEFVALANRTKFIFASTFENGEDRKVYQDHLLAEFSAMARSVEKIADHLGIFLPIDVDHFIGHTLALLETLPDVIFKELLAHLPKVDFSTLHEVADKITAAPSTMATTGTVHHYDPGTIRKMAFASGACTILSGILKLIYKSLPMKVGLGLNLAVTANGKARGVAEGDVSAGVAEGAGVTVPILGIGIYLNGGMGNGTLLNLEAIWVGIVPAILAPIGVLLDTTAQVLEAEIKIEKGVM